MMSFLHTRLVRVPTISFHVLFAANDGWHLTAVDLLSTDNHKSACTTDVNKRVHCVRAGQLTTGPLHTRVGWKPRLVCCVCDNYQQAIDTRAAPRFLRARYWIGTEPQNWIN